MRREIGALLIAVFTLCATIVVTQYTPTFPYVTPLEGVPVSDTVFAELVRTEPDQVMLSQFPVVVTNKSITIRLDFDRLEKVNESIAINASLDFIARIWYLSNRNFTIDSGWTNLDRKQWHIRFIDENTGGYVHVGVNAFSGKVDSFSVGDSFSGGWEPIESNTTTPSSNEFEQLVIDFLSEFNYSLSPHARYIGPSLESYSYMPRDLYGIYFRNVVNGTQIKGGVHFSMDVGANAVQSFSYFWTHVDAIPLERIITAEEAKFNVSYYLRTLNYELPKYEIRSATLLFRESWIPAGRQYRLCWSVDVDFGYVTSLYIDAMSGRPCVYANYMIPYGPSEPEYNYYPLLAIEFTLFIMIVLVTLRKHRELSQLGL